RRRNGVLSLADALGTAVALGCHRERFVWRDWNAAAPGRLQPSTGLAASVELACDRADSGRTETRRSRTVCPDFPLPPIGLAGTSGLSGSGIASGDRNVFVDPCFLNLSARRDRRRRDHASSD